MSIIQKTSATANSVATINPSLTGVVSGDALILLADGFALSDSLPTDSAGQIWQKGFYYSFVGLVNTAQVACYYLLNANAGTHTLSWASGIGQFCNYAMLEIPPCIGVDVAGALASGADTIATLSATVTTVNALDAVIGMFCAHAVNGTNPAGITDPPAGYISIRAQQDTGGNAGDECCYKEVAVAGVQNATWNFSADLTGSAYAAAMISFKLTPPVVAPSLMGHGIYVSA